MMTTTTAPGAHVSPKRVTAEALEALYATGHGLYSRERYEDAAAVFRVLVLCAPEEERGYVALGACHEGLEQPEVALEIYAAALIATPYAARCQVARARLMRTLHLDDYAREAIDEAERLAELRGDEDVLALVAFERSRGGGRS
jgi:tetratricopeptide (TPR) repeat protein